MCRFYLLISILLLGSWVSAQDVQPPNADSIPSLGTVTVKGFETGKKRLDIPASVSNLGTRDLQRFSNTSFVPVLNTVPGVRMEERSPGSYRLSMRGSLLRSPFGIRNIKIYWNDFILTDAGGNTYLNLVDFNSAGSIEILKGPASSMYGAGTGGVVVLKSPPAIPDMDSLRKKQDFTLQVTGGSYGQFSEEFRWSSGTKKIKWQFMQGHFQADGYRQNSRMRREVIQANLQANTGERNRIEGLILLSDLFYATPGGLTKVQMEADPRQARPATPTLPSATEQKAGIYNRTAIFGVSDIYRFNERWSNTVSATFSFTDFKNPFISNYEKRNENNFGVREKLVYEGVWGNTPVSWITGFEWQEGYYRIDSTGNVKGQPDANLVSDKVRASQKFAFTQIQFEFISKLILQAGISINDFKNSFERVVGEPQSGKIPVDFNAQVAPRIGFLYKPLPTLAIHVSSSRGFSPPSTAEIRPSAGGISTGLQAEKGWSHELGIKGTLIRNRLQFDVSFFRFNLEDAIVRRTNPSGAEYFINAGGTRQNGIEAYLEGWLVQKPSSAAISQLRLFATVTLNDFTFKDYTVNSSEYSGNRITGVPREVIVAGMDLRFLRHFYLNTTFNYTSSMPLNDANDVFADPYSLLGFRIGWQKILNRTKLELYIGADNLTNEKYSLGNDLNAFGGRYYNPAATSNVYGGVIFKF